MAATSRYLDRYDIDAHVATMCRTYREKRDLLLTTLRETFPETVEHTTPEGGLFTWLSFLAGCDTTTFMRDVALGDPLLGQAGEPG